MNMLAEYVIGLLMEDRIDDLIARYPDLKLNRPKLEQWLEFDPTNNKKYFPWIVKQVATKKLALPKGGERIRDNLMRFDRLLSIPTFTQSRDINQYDAKTLEKMIRQTADIQSKSEKEKENRFKNVKVVGKSGNIVVVEIKNSQELVNRSREAYSKNNPNWDGRKREPIEYQANAQLDDGLWCIRFMSFARSYLADGPFYLVYKNNGPYVGIVFERGECQTLDNQGISLGVAEEIYPAMKPVLDQKAKEGEGLTRHCAVFTNMRFLNGEAKDGETVSGEHRNLDLSWSSLSRLPNNLTVNGALNLTGCPIAQLPAGLTVAGGVLRIAGTQITTLPTDMAVEEMEWSEPLDLGDIKKLFYRMRLGEMKKHFWKSEKLYVPELDATGKEIMITQRNAKGKTEKVPKPKLDAKGNKIPMSEEQKEQAWIKFQPELINYFMTHPKMETSAKAVLHYVPANKLQRGKSE